MAELKDVLHLVTEGGALVLLTLVLLALYRVIRDLSPSLKEWLQQDTAAKIEYAKILSALEAKVDVTHASLSQVEARITAVVRREQLGAPSQRSEGASSAPVPSQRSGPWPPVPVVSTP